MNRKHQRQESSEEEPVAKKQAIDSLLAAVASQAHEKGYNQGKIDTLTGIQNAFASIGHKGLGNIGKGTSQSGVEEAIMSALKESASEAAINSMRAVMWF